MTNSLPQGNIQQAQKELGKRIQILREDKGLREQRLGHDCGISAIKVKKIAAGTVDPAVCTIRVAERLNVKLVDLFGGIA